MKWTHLVLTGSFVHCRIEKDVHFSYFWTRCVKLFLVSLLYSGSMFKSTSIFPSLFTFWCWVNVYPQCDEVSSFSKMEAGSWMTVQDSTSFWTLASSHCGSSFPKHWMRTHDIYDSHEFVIFEIWVSRSVLKSCLQSPRVTAPGIETIEK